MAWRCYNCPNLTVTGDTLEHLKDKHGWPRIPPFARTDLATDMGADEVIETRRADKLRRAQLHQENEERRLKVKAERVEAAAAAAAEAARVEEAKGQGWDLLDAPGDDADKVSEGELGGVATAEYPQLHCEDEDPEFEETAHSLVSWALDRDPYGEEMMPGDGFGM
ncbi:hypothetical protein K490DRAFT_56217 [Saccharata proteae CBS 121410]|uniref:Uncharacterized protein n=1 Tax=Saccharata proteae CBS 121410 TaxID=1314787 RepID=A0A9P4HY53_9PEZI|nr:hypothetical protein K490DRAFT_56217 [Saccharata proteae CBS 121410]